MKLSNKSRYGIQALFDLAFHGEGKAAQIREICERQAIPARFLEQVLSDLKKAGLVSSKRGPRGGYQLARAPQDIGLGDVVRAIEGPIRLVSDEPPSRTVGQTTSFQVARSVLGEVAERMEACLDEVTLADLTRRAEQEGLARAWPSRYVYAI